MHICCEEKFHFTNDRLAFIMRNPDSSEVNVSPPAKKGHSAPAQYLPEFEVVDASSISITEITSDLQSSLAQNGFSASAIQLSVSGGAFGVSAGYRCTILIFESAADNREVSPPASTNRPRPVSAGPGMILKNSTLQLTM